MLSYFRNCDRFMLVWLITLFLLIFLLLRFDIVRGLDDIALEENLEKGLLDGRTILVKNLMSDLITIEIQPALAIAVAWEPFEFQLWLNQLPSTPD